MTRTENKQSKMYKPGSRVPCNVKEEKTKYFVTERLVRDGDTIKWILDSIVFNGNFLLFMVE